MEEGVRRIRGVFAIALAMLATAHAGGIRDPAPAAAEDPRAIPPSLVLEVPDELRLGIPTLVGAEGFADPGLALWLFADPRGTPCAATPASQSPDSLPIDSAVPVSGAFFIDAPFRPKRLGPHAFCAYLGPSPEASYLVAEELRHVRRPRLRAEVARQTVVIALRRHRFASRVVNAVEQRCRRRSRSEFACRFSASFPGYELTGRGRIVLGERLTYRFRVEAQGRDLVLTDDDERPHGAGRARSARVA